VELDEESVGLPKQTSLYQSELSPKLSNLQFIDNR